MMSIQNNGCRKRFFRCYRSRGWEHRVWLMILGFWFALLNVVLATQDSVAPRVVIDLPPIQSRGESRGTVFVPGEEKLLTWKYHSFRAFMSSSLTYKEIQIWDIRNQKRNFDGQIARQESSPGGELLTTRAPIMDPSGKWMAFDLGNRVLVIDADSGRAVLDAALAWNIDDELFPKGRIVFVSPNFLVANMSEGEEETRGANLLQLWNTDTWTELPRISLSAGDSKAGRFAQGPLLHALPGGRLLREEQNRLTCHDLVQQKLLWEIDSIEKPFQKLPGRDASHTFCYTLHESKILLHSHTEMAEDSQQFARLEYELSTGNRTTQSTTQMRGKKVGCWWDLQNDQPHRLANAFLWPTTEILLGNAFLSQTIGWRYLESATPNRLLLEENDLLFVDGIEHRVKYRIPQISGRTSRFDSGQPPAVINIFNDYAFLPNEGSERGVVALYRKDEAGVQLSATCFTDSPVHKLIPVRSGRMVAAICEGNLNTGGSTGPHVMFLDVPTLKKHAPMKIGNLQASCLAISDDGSLTAIRLNDLLDSRQSLIQIHDSRTGETRQSLKAPLGISALAFNSDASKVAAASDRHVYLWSLEAGQGPETLTMKEGPVTIMHSNGKSTIGERKQFGVRSVAILFRSDGALVVSSVQPGTAKLDFTEWSDGQQTGKFGFEQDMEFLRFSAHDREWALVNQSGTIAMIDIRRRQLVKRTGLPAVGSRVFDVDPSGEVGLMINSSTGDFASLLLVNANRLETIASTATIMQSVNDGLILSNEEVVLGGQIPRADSFEVVDLKLGTASFHLENQTLLVVGRCHGLNYFVTRDAFPKTDSLHFWRLEDGLRFASVMHPGLSRSPQGPTVIVSPTGELVATTSGEAIRIWSLADLKSGLGIPE
jgi:hypothetical protein